MKDWQDDYYWHDINDDKRIGILVTNKKVDIIIQVEGINYPKVIDIDQTIKELEKWKNQKF